MTEILKSQKHVFWQALLLAVFVFSFGILLGFLLESSRTAEIEGLYNKADIELLDVKIQNELLDLNNINCNAAIQENIKFADKVYQEAKLLDDYEDASRLSDSIKIQHTKYDLLRTLFWINSIKLKQMCNASYHNLVYLYDYNNPRLDVRAKQEVFSRLLGEVKQDMGDRVMLIPLAGDNNLASISLLMNSYNVLESELPVILIDEKIKITNLDSEIEIEKYLG